MEDFKNLNETVVQSEEIFDGQVLHLFKDTVELPNGKNATRETIRHIGAVAIVPMTEDGKVIVERQFRYPLNCVITEIPAVMWTAVKLISIPILCHILKYLGLG